MNQESQSLRHILQPLAVGPIALKNRVVRTGHGTGLGGGTISNDLIEYHAERAIGGVGLTILELMALHSSAYPFLRAESAGVLEGYRELMARVRPLGMRVFQQLGHLGNEIMQADGSPPWSSSATVGAFVGIPAEAMTKSQIDELVECYVAAARVCAEGGLDGVELHMAHGYLVQQFLSPLFNHRTDAYGGPFENRIRIALEIAQAVRAVLPAHMVLGVRLSPDSQEGGFTADDVSGLVRIFTDRGLVDYLSLTMGSDYDMHKIIGGMHEPTGYELEANAPIKPQVEVPVLVTGRFRTLEEADAVIRTGQADMVALTRAHIADPDLVEKTLAGRVDDVRPCIGCNHGCIGGLLSVGRIGCAVNPAVGAEASLSERLIVKAETPRRLLVVGGGPAGLEAARIGALRGHEVILVEAGASLGGAINIARRAPRRHGIGDIVDWQERQVFQLGVDVRLSTYLTSEEIVAMAPDAVILATGSSPTIDGIQHLSPGTTVRGFDRPEVVTSEQVMMDRSNRDWGTRAIVFDDVGHYEAIAAAEFLQERGLRVVFITSLSSFAPKLEVSLSSIPALERLARGDFELITYSRLVAVEDKSVSIEARFGGPVRSIEADTIVWVAHNRSNRDLVDELAATPIPTVAVGDARSPRFLQTAIREGHMAARSI